MLSRSPPTAAVLLVYPAKFDDDELSERLVRWVIWSSEQAHLVDALAAEGDEGRCSLR